MKILITQACIIDRSSPHNGTIRDILIENGRIMAIGKRPGLRKRTGSSDTPDCTFLRAGWIFSLHFFVIRGTSIKKHSSTGAAAAAAGGYTDCLCHPPIPGPSSTPNHAGGIHPAGYPDLLARQHLAPGRPDPRPGREKTSPKCTICATTAPSPSADGTQPVQSAGLLLKKALQYVKAFDGTIIQVPDDRTVRGANGLMNEGMPSPPGWALPGKPHDGRRTHGRKGYLANWSGIPDSRGSISPASAPPAHSTISAKPKGIGTLRQLLGDASSSLFHGRRPGELRY